MTTPPSAEQNPAKADGSYTRIFELLVDAPDDLVGLIAYGRYKWSKREWIRQKTEETGHHPAAQALRDYAGAWTESQLATIRKAADDALSEYALTILRQETPRIEAKALKEASTFRMDVVAGILSAFAYTLILIVVALILRVEGVDLVHVFKGTEQLAPPLETRSAAPPAPPEGSTALQPTAHQLATRPMSAKSE